LNFPAPAAMPTTSWMVCEGWAHVRGPQAYAAPGPAVEALLC
jgi:hypothetical protein